MRKPRPSGPERFARDFTALVAQKAMRNGRWRNCRSERFVKWAEQILRSSHGNLERLVDPVFHKLWWLVYGVSANALDKMRCWKKAWVFVRRHKFILAEQVLSSNVAEEKTDKLHPLLFACPPTVGFPKATRGQTVSVSRRIVRDMVKAAKERLKKVRNAPSKKARRAAP